MKCAGCIRTVQVSNCIKCTSGSCSKYFCSSCIKLSDYNTEQRKSWRCPECCAAAKKGGDNNATPVRGTDSQTVTTRKKQDLQCQEFDPSEVKELLTEVRLLTHEISSLKQKLEEATQSLISCHTRLEEIETKGAANEARIKLLEERDKEKRKEVSDLKLNISALQNEINTQAQVHLRNEIEISGIPEAGNENLHHIVLLAVRKVGVELIDEDIDWVTRVGARNSVDGKEVKFSRPVVVRLLRRQKRDQIIKASRSRKNITTSDLEVPGPPMKIYYNERLTKDNRLLFREARTKAKEHGYAHCWCNQGAIFVRQGEGKPARRVPSLQDLYNIFPNTVIPANQ